jgi:SAM-dependent methyltransferase
MASRQSRALRYEIERELADKLRSAATVEQRRRLYGEVYDERSRRITDHPLVERAADSSAGRIAAEPQLRLLRPLLGPDVAFVEVGAGDGALAYAVAPHVRSALALDVTDVLATPDDPARGYGFRVFDGFDLGVEGIDVVYSNDVVEHLHPDDFADHAGAILKALRPGGTYVCVTPNRLSGPHDISQGFTHAPSGFHLREYTATELAAALRRAGFARVSIVLSVGGRRLTPEVRAEVIAPLEWLFERLPSPIRRRGAVALAAVKVIAHKAYA